MDRDEHLLALSQAYLEASTSLRLEELILEAMGPVGSQASAGQLAQRERVEALKRVVAQFSKAFPTAGGDHAG